MPMSGSTVVKQDQKSKITRIIDTCTHAMPPQFASDRDSIFQMDRTFRSLFANPKAKLVDAQNLIDSMDKSGVDTSVCAGFGWTDPGVARESNNYNIEASGLHPDRLIPFCSVNPLWGQEAVNEVQRCYEAGARGIGELHPDTQGILDADISVLAPVLDIARQLDMPVLIHASEPVGHSYPGKGTVTPELLMTLVNAYPNNKLIFGHFGGGLPFYGLMNEVRAALSNVYFDSAAFPFLYRPEIFEVVARSIGTEKILFASDFPLVSQKRSLKEFTAARMTDEQSHKILSDNAAELLNI